MTNLHDLLGNVDPTQKTIQIVHPQTGKPMVVPNPLYKGPPSGPGPGGMAPSQGIQQRQEEENEDEDEKSWCPIVRNWCPESPLCVYWYGPPSGEEKSEEDAGCCVMLAEIVSKDRANTAKAIFFEKAIKLADSALSGDADSSALASLINHAATSIQLSNEKLLREEEKNLPKIKKVSEQKLEKPLKDEEKLDSPKKEEESIE